MKRGIYILKKYDWFMVGLVMFVAVIFFCSSDLGATASHSIYLWDSVFSGNFIHVYSDFIQNPLTITACYTPPLYILFGIWNFPVYILYKLGVPIIREKNLLSFSATIWNKLFIFIFILLMLKAIDKIAEIYHISSDNRKYLSFSVASSFFVIYPALIMGQYDVISAAITLLGIVAYLEDNEKKFLLAFIIAAGLKFFAIFIFIPLVLLEEKNFFKAFIKSLSVFIVPIISKLIFRGDTAYRYVNEFSKQKLFSLLEKTMPGNFSVVPIVAMLMISICIYAYITDASRKKDYAIYIPFAVYGTIFCFMSFGPYWIILIIPYAMLICFMNLGKQQKTSINFLMMLAAEVSICILTLYYHHDNLDYALLYRGLLYGKLKYQPPSFSIYGLVENKGLGTYILCVEALFIVCVFFLFFSNLPPRKKEEFEIRNDTLSGHDKWILYIKSFVTILFMLVTVSCFVFPARFSYNFLELSYECEVSEETDSYSIKSGGNIASRRLVLQPGEYKVEITGEGLAKEGIDYYVLDQGMYAGAHDFDINDDSVRFDLSIMQYTENVMIMINPNENLINMKGIDIEMVSSNL